MALSGAARRFLAEKRFAVLATIGADNLPQQTVMWYELRGDAIIMNTAAGRLKDRYMRRDPRVSICVAEAYTYVTITGRVEIVDDQTTAQEDIKRLAVRYHGQEDGEKQAREQFSKQQRVTLRLAIEQVIENGLGGE